MVHLVLHPHGIAPAFLKHERKKSDKERKMLRKGLMHTKRFNKFLKIWVQFRVGAIPLLPSLLQPKNRKVLEDNIIFIIKYKKIIIHYKQKYKNVGKTYYKNCHS